MSDDPKYGEWVTTVAPVDSAWPKYRVGKLEAYVTLPTDPRVGAQKRKRERRKRRRFLRRLAARAPKWPRFEV